MSEQQVAAQNAQDAGAPDTNNVTQLEGIRQKVFIDRYSLKDAAGQALEHYPEQLWARVARGIAEVEKTPEASAEWEKKFFDALSDFQFVPAASPPGGIQAASEKRAPAPGDCGSGS